MADEEKRQIILDGSYGCGPVAELTIITRAGEGREKEETYTVPFALINMDVLNAFNHLHLILGYKVLKIDKPSNLKELGL